jgi:hypothetical protein
MPTRSSKLSGKSRTKSGIKNRKNTIRNRKKSSLLKRLKRSPKGRQIISLAAVIILLGVSGTFLAGLAYVKNLTKGFASATSVTSYSISERDVFSVLYISVEDFSARPLFIHSIKTVFLDREEDRALVYEINPNMVVNIPGRYGNEEIYKVLALGSLKNPESVDGGLELLDKTILSLFGYRTDKYVVADSSLNTEFNELFTKGDATALLSFDAIKKLNNSMMTNLTFNEFYDIYRLLTQAPADKFMVKFFDDRYILNPDLLDSEIRDLTFDSYVANEKKSVSVLNGAGVPGVANFGARIVNNAGEGWLVSAMPPSYTKRV